MTVNIINNIFIFFFFLLLRERIKIWNSRHSTPGQWSDHAIYLVTHPEDHSSSNHLNVLVLNSIAHHIKSNSLWEEIWINFFFFILYKLNHTHKTDFCCCPHLVVGSMFHIRMWTSCQQGHTVVWQHLSRPLHAK